MVILTNILVLLIYFTIVFIIADKKKNNGFIDIAWGFGFVIIALISLIYSNYSERSILILALIMLWGLRLSIHLFKRNWNKEEDYRYKEMRKKWGKNQRVKAYTNVYLTQMVLMLIIGSQIILIFIISINSGMFYLTIISPLLITYLLLFVSGVPLLEKKYENNKEFIEYAKVTSKFFPLPRKEK